MQVIDVVIHKYEQGSHGAEVFQEYEKGLQALLGAYKASSPGEHFQIAEQDSSRLEQVYIAPALCCVVTGGKDNHTYLRCILGVGGYFMYLP